MENVYAQIRDVAYHLPETVLDNDRLASDYPEWTSEKIEQKTGIVERRIVARGECSSDLAVAAAKNLFAQGSCSPEDIDYILLCTQSPDYFLPATACLVQHRLGISKRSGAFDFNLGCSGFVTGLGIAKGLIETGQARNVLLLTAETYSRFINEKDKSVRSIFGDGAAATLVCGVETNSQKIGPFVSGTDGSGSCHLIVPTGGMRNPRTMGSSVATERESGNFRSEDNLYMNGSEIFTFTLRTIPTVLSSLLERAQLTMDEVALFVFHQANAYMLEHLRKKTGIPEEKFWLALRKFGNTVSSTIPIALTEAQKANRLKSGDRIVLLGFGVGYSWSGTVIEWP